MSPEINSFATEFLASILSFCTELLFDARKNDGCGYRNWYISVTKKNLDMEAVHPWNCE